MYIDRPTYNPIGYPLTALLALIVIHIPVVAVILYYRIPPQAEMFLTDLGLIVPLIAVVIYQREKAQRCHYEIGEHGVRLQNWSFDRDALAFVSQKVEVPYADIFEVRPHRNLMQRLLGTATLTLVVPGSQPTVTVDDYRTTDQMHFDWLFGHGEGRGVYRLYDIANWREVHRMITPRLTRMSPFRRTF